MRSKKEIESQIECLAARLKKGGLRSVAMHPIRMQIRILYWVLERELKGKYHWSIDDI